MSSKRSSSVWLDEPDDLSDSESTQKSKSSNNSSSSSSSESGPNAYYGPNANGPRKQSAPRGKCKFDGTDYPDWLPINPFLKAEDSFRFPFPEVEGDPMSNAAKWVQDYDDKMCNAWVEEIQNILIFAGLFSAVVTAFAVETQQLLQPDPGVASVLLLAHLSAQLANSSTSTSTIGTIVAPFQQSASENNPTQSLRINALIFFSLVLSLGTALVGIISLQWIRSYKQSGPSQTNKERISLRHTRYESLMHWKVPQIISALPLVLQASLIIFFAGLIDFLQSLNNTVTIIISSLVGVIITFVLFTMIAPCISVIRNPVLYDTLPSAPPPSLSAYQSPQSWLFVQLVLSVWKNYHHIFTTQSGNWAVWFPVTAPLLTATTWSQFAQAHNQFQDQGGRRHIGSAFGWIFRHFTDIESFCSLFHCFQTLDSEEMQCTLGTLRGKLSDSRPISEIVVPVATGSSVRLASAPALKEDERKHLMSLGLIYWAKFHEYWEHDEIDLYELELSLRAMSYGDESPPSSSDPLLVTSRSPMFRRIMARSRFSDLHGLFDTESDELLAFGFLVSLKELQRGKFFNPSAGADRDHLQLLLQMQTQRLVKTMDHCSKRKSFRLIDDVFRVFDDWLDIWYTGNLDAEIEDPCKRVMDHFMHHIHHNFIASHQSHMDALQRPCFLAMLDKSASHPMGQGLWQSFPDSTKMDWDRFFVDAHLEGRYAALIFDPEGQGASRPGRQGGDATPAPAEWNHQMWHRGCNGHEGASACVWDASYNCNMASASPRYGYRHR